MAYSVMGRDRARSSLGFRFFLDLAPNGGMAKDRFHYIDF
jgi:hypothetical protein